MEQYFLNLKWRLISAGCDGPDQVNEGVFLQYNVGGMQGFTKTKLPFSSNPMPYTNEAYFIPPGNGNPLANT